MLARTMVRIPALSRGIAPPKGGEDRQRSPRNGSRRLAAHEIAPRRRLRCFVASARVRDLLIRAKDLFVAAIDGWGSPGFAPNRSNPNMTAGPVAFGAAQATSKAKTPDAENAAAEGNGLIS